MKTKFLKFALASAFVAFTIACNSNKNESGASDSDTMMMNADTTMMMDTSATPVPSTMDTIGTGTGTMGTDTAGGAVTTPAP